MAVSYTHLDVYKRQVQGFFRFHNSEIFKNHMFSSFSVYFWKLIFVFFEIFRRNITKRFDIWYQS